MKTHLEKQKNYTKLYTNYSLCIFLWWVFPSCHRTLVMPFNWVWTTISVPQQEDPLPIRLSHLGVQGFPPLIYLDIPLGSDIPLDLLQVLCSLGQISLLSLVQRERSFGMAKILAKQNPTSISTKQEERRSTSIHWIPSTHWMDRIQQLLRECIKTNTDHMVKRFTTLTGFWF